MSSLFDEIENAKNEPDLLFDVLLFTQVNSDFGICSGEKTNRDEADP